MAGGVAGAGEPRVYFFDAAIAAEDSAPYDFITSGISPRSSIAGWRSSSRISSMLSIPTSSGERSDFANSDQSL